MKKFVASRAVAGITSSALRLTGALVIFLAVGSAANAAVPEIDPGSMSSGLALLAGGILWAAGRRPRK